MGASRRAGALGFGVLAAIVVALLGIGAGALAFRGAEDYDATLFIFSNVAALPGALLALGVFRNTTPRPARAAGLVGLLLSALLGAFWVWFWLTFEGN